MSKETNKRAASLAAKYLAMDIRDIAEIPLRQILEEVKSFAGSALVQVELIPNKETRQIRADRKILPRVGSLRKSLNCSQCGGTGQYLMSADAHRSEGWVPCHSCGGTGRSSE